MTLRRIILTGGALLTIGAAAVSLPRATDAARSLPFWGLKAVLITGNRAVTDSQILAAAGLTTGQNIFLVDLTAAAARVTGNPWIAACRMARVLPDRIVIEVTEQAPAAVLQRPDGFRLTDASGRTLQAVETPQAFPTLPLITAGDESVTDVEAVGAGLSISGAFAAWKGTLPPVSEIVVFPGGRAEVFALDRPLRVILSVDDPDEAVRRWASLGPVLAAAGNRAHALDLRHRGRAYLRQEETGGTQG